MDNMPSDYSTLEDEPEEQMNCLKNNMKQSK